MMEQKHDHLDYCIETDWTEEEMDIYDLNMKNMVDSFLNGWFHHRYSGTNTHPTDAEVDRATRSIQAKVYQTIQHEADKERNLRWPKVLPERFDISSAAGSDN